MCVFVALAIQHAMLMRHIGMFPDRLHRRCQHYKLQDFLKKNVITLTYVH
jgi:hypothetical protein